MNRNNRPFHILGTFSKLACVILLTVMLSDLQLSPAVHAATAAVDITNDELDGADGGACASANIADYDGDGSSEEGIAGEIDSMRAALLTAIQEYAASVAGTPLVYDPQISPYFFVDTDGDGEADADETGAENRYASWTPRLVRATYNYHYAVRDPGGFAHNPDYVLQILHDSVEDLGGDVSGMVRP